ncbi:MAG: S8 family serine peptidase, partial [Acidobacteriota bacterium]
MSGWVLGSVGALLLLLMPLADHAGAQRSTRQPVGGLVLEARDSGRAKAVSDFEEQRLVSVIVQLDEPSLATRARALPRAVASRTEKRGKGVDVSSADARGYLSHLRSRQDDLERFALTSVPRARIGRRLQVVLNAVSMIVPQESVQDLKRMPGVKGVYPDSKQQLQTMQSPAYISAPALWAQLGGQSNAGEGVVIGVLDSGVWPEHPSLADPGPGGVGYSPAVGWNGAPCQFGSITPNDPGFACNNKLIGARRMMSTYDSIETLLPGEFASARDDSGHGTHIATVSAGNADVAASITGNNLGLASGVAPRAKIAAYKICGAQGCYASDAVAAVEQAVLDGVDVINYAVSGGSDPYADAVSLALLDAYDAGVFVAIAAGNTGIGSAGHAEPWTTTVGATTINRTFQSTLSVSAPGGGTLTVVGASVTRGIPSAVPIVNAAAAGDPYCTAASPAGTFAGRIVVCTRGGNTRTEKSFNVQQRGAVGMVLINPSLLGVSVDSHFIPTVHLEKAAGDSLLTYLSSRPTATASFTAGVGTTVPGDIMAAFSSRGSGTQLLGISKPDLVAPGVQIVAGNTPSAATPVAGASGQLFMALEGTSIASAHVAGAGALLRALNPTWTPGQINSALMMTATAVVKREDGITPATPFDFGSGRVQLKGAGRPGLS